MTLRFLWCRLRGVFGLSTHALVRTVGEPIEDGPLRGVRSVFYKCRRCRWCMGLA